MTRRVFRFGFRSRAEARQDVEAEFEFHLQARIDDLRRQGLEPHDATRQAEREFGDRERVWRAACAWTTSASGRE